MSRKSVGIRRFLFVSRASAADCAVTDAGYRLLASVKSRSASWCFNDMDYRFPNSCIAWLRSSIEFILYDMF